MALNQPTLVSRSTATASIGTRWRRAWNSAVVALLGVMALAGCGGGGEDASATAAVQVDASRTAKAMIGPSGGNVSATAADGRRYTLTVPAGALASNTEITATPVTSMGAAPLAAGVKGAVRFGPSGLKFGQAATLRIEGAATTATAGKRLVGFLRSDDGAAMQLVPLEVVGNALELPVSHFSDGGAAEATAEEIAAVPLAPITDPVEELFDIFVRETSINRPEAEEIALLVRLHDQLVLPLLTSADKFADDRTRDELRESAVATWAAWQGLLDSTGLAAKTGARVQQARALAGRMLLAQVDRGRTACLAPPPVDFRQLDGLWRALWAQKVAQLRGLDAPDLGLDADTVARRMNDCARVAFVPKAVPAFEAGRAVSLDAQADLIYAADPNRELPVDFEFTVSTSDGAIANPRGFSGVSGLYTTVVTPSAASAVFEVRACLTTFMANLAPVPSVMCGRQAVSARTKPVFAGEVTYFRIATGAVTGRVRVRLQAEPDGRYTVLEASGNIAFSTSGVIDRCNPFTPGLPDVLNIPFTSSHDSTITGGTQAPELAAGQFIFINMTGETTIVNDEIDIDCRVTRRVVNTTNAGGLQILSIERDALGAPLVVVIGDRNRSHEGRLVREP